MRTKSFITSFVLLTSFSSAKAEDVASNDTTMVIFQIDDTSIDETRTLPIPHAPVRVPTLYISGHMLILRNGCSNCMLELYDEEGKLVYFNYIPEGIEQIFLPFDFVGIYELQIIRGCFTFVAQIVL